MSFVLSSGHPVPLNGNFQLLIEVYAGILFGRCQIAICHTDLEEIKQLIDPPTNNKYQILFRKKNARAKCVGRLANHPLDEDL
jgi:hypothetical protein